MKKRILSIVSVLSLVVCLSLTSLVSVRASDNSKEKIDGSYLTFAES